MDTLIWVVYMADIVENLPKFLLSLAGFLGFVFFVLTIALIFTIIARITGLCSEKVTQGLKEYSKTIIRVYVLLGIFYTLLGGAAALVPKKETVYIMAGIKAADLALDTPIAKKTMVLVESKLDAAIANLKEEKEKAVEKAVNNAASGVAPATASEPSK